jgi:hypothetical protein
MSTRFQVKQKALEEGIRIVENIFDDCDPEPIKEALQSQGLLSKNHILRASRASLEKCKFLDIDGNEQPLYDSEIENILIFQAYSEYRKIMRDAITEWDKVTADELQEFVSLRVFNVSTNALDLNRIDKLYEQSVAATTTTGVGRNPGNVCATSGKSTVMSEWNKARNGILAFSPN